MASKSLRKIGTVAAAIGASLGLTIGSASADTQYVSWYNYPGYESTWQCNQTGSFRLADGSWAYVQACISINGNYRQGLYNVSFSESHSNVVLEVNNHAFTGTGRQCSGWIVSGVEQTCFAQTYYSQHLSIEYAEADGIQVDGIGYSLAYPTYGPKQVTSPATY